MTSSSSLKVSNLIALHWSSKRNFLIGAARNAALLDDGGGPGAGSVSGIVALDPFLCVGFPHGDYTLKIHYIYNNTLAPSLRSLRRHRNVYVN